MEGGVWAVVECRLHGENTYTTPKDILAFSAAFDMRDAERGYYVTTGKLTRPAREMASRYDWLTVVSGRRVVKFIEKQLGAGALGQID